MCHLIYDLFGEGILLGIELPVCVSVCVAQMDGKLNRQTTKTRKNHSAFEPCDFFPPQKCQFIVHICKLAIIFVSRRMYCCRHRHRHRLIFISLFMPRFLYYSAF